MIGMRNFVISVAALAALQGMSWAAQDCSGPQFGPPNPACLPKTGAANAGIAVYKDYSHYFDENPQVGEWAVFPMDGGPGSGFSVGLRTGPYACSGLFLPTPFLGCNAGEVRAYISESPAGPPVQDGLCDVTGETTQATTMGVQLSYFVDSPQIDPRLQERVDRATQRHQKRNPEWNWVDHFRQSGCVLQPDTQYYLNLILVRQGYTDQSASGFQDSCPVSFMAPRCSADGETTSTTARRD